jgi:Uma2 family endonuclease
MLEAADSTWPAGVSRPPSGDELPKEDGIPLESNRHRLLMNLLIEILSYHLRDRRDYFVSGNMFLYYSALQQKKNDFRGPDVFVVLDTEHKQRDSWVAWEEDGKYPNVIIELTSESTAAIDRGDKKRLYEKVLRIPEYFIYDPATHALEGYELQNWAYVPIQPTAAGRLPSRQLGLELGLWEGPFQEFTDTWLRFYQPDGTLVPIYGEAKEMERQKAEAERQKAEARARELEQQLRAYADRFGPLKAE